VRWRFVRMMQRCMGDALAWACGWVEMRLSAERRTAAREEAKESQTSLIIAQIVVGAHMLPELELLQGP
jgi:hypothetical protein